MGAAGKMEHYASTGATSACVGGQVLVCLGARAGVDQSSPAAGAQLAVRLRRRRRRRCHPAAPATLFPALPWSLLLRSGPASSREAAEAKYQEMADTEKPNFPGGERSVNEMVRAARGPRPRAATGGAGPGRGRLLGTCCAGAVRLLGAWRWLGTPPPNAPAHRQPALALACRHLPPSLPAASSRRCGWRRASRATRPTASARRTRPSGGWGVTQWGEVVGWASV